MKKTVSRVLSVILTILISVCIGIPAFAGETQAGRGSLYEPLTVSIPVSGKGTYVLTPVSANAPAPSSEEITVDGKGSWSLTFTEPGTYNYELSDKNRAANRRDVSVYVENSESGLGLKGTVQMSKDGEKRDANFTTETTESRGKQENEKPTTETTAKETTENVTTQTTGKETTENSGTDTSSKSSKKNSGGSTSGGNSSSSESSSTGSRTGSGTGGHPRTGDSGWLGYAGLAGGSLAMILLLVAALRRENRSGR